MNFCLAILSIGVLAAFVVGQPVPELLAIHQQHRATVQVQQMQQLQEFRQDLKTTRADVLMRNLQQNEQVFVRQQREIEDQIRDPRQLLQVQQQHQFEREVRRLSQQIQMLEVQIQNEQGIGKLILDHRQGSAAAEQALQQQLAASRAGDQAGAPSSATLMAIHHQTRINHAQAQQVQMQAYQQAVQNSDITLTQTQQQNQQALIQQQQEVESKTQDPLQLQQLKRRHHLELRVLRLEQQKQFVEHQNRNERTMDDLILEQRQSTNELERNLQIQVQGERPAAAISDDFSAVSYDEISAEAITDEFSAEYDEFSLEDPSSAVVDPTTQSQLPTSSSPSEQTPTWAVALIVLGSVVGVLLIVVQVQIVVLLRTEKGTSKMDVEFA